MKKIYEEYLHVPEDGKIKEKVFIIRIVVAIVCVVCCLSAMGFSAYAFFTSSITSGVNTIMAATYNTEITIVEEISQEVMFEQVPNESPMVSSFQLGAEQNNTPKTYTVTMKAVGNATTGYCKIIVGDIEEGNEYYTIQMSPEEQDSSNQLKFTINCYEENTQIHFVTNWGSCIESEKERIGYNGGSSKIVIGAPANISEVSDGINVSDENIRE